MLNWFWHKLGELNRSHVIRRLKQFFIVSNFIQMHSLYTQKKPSPLHHNIVQHHIAHHNIVCASQTTCCQCAYYLLTTLKLLLESPLLRDAPNHHHTIIKCQYIDFWKELGGWVHLTGSCTEQTLIKKKKKRKSLANWQWIILTDQHLALFFGHCICRWMVRREVRTPDRE